MISVMVVDGFGEGIPVAWALSNDMRQLIP